MIGLGMGLGLGLPLDLLLLSGAPVTTTPPEPPPPSTSVAPTPQTRWDPWDRGAPLVVSVRASELVDETGAPIAANRVTSFTALVADADVTTPAVSLPTRAPVALTLSNGRWRAVLPYGADLDPLTAVRLVVTATIDGTPVRLLESTARFVLADGA